MSPLRPWQAFWLGTHPYDQLSQVMTSLADLRRKGEIADTLLLLEHEPVITLGRGAKAEHILEGRDTLRQLGVAVTPTGRGGDVTLHAPGQLIAYPIFDLSPDRRDVRKYVQSLTRIMAHLVAPYGLQGGTVDGLIGLWLDTETPGAFPGQEQARNLVKIGAIGVRISRWITSHGFALNLTTDLSLFRLIVPCGVREHGVTSVLEASGQRLSTETAAVRAHELFAEEFSKPPTELIDLSSLTTDRLLSRVGGR